MTEGKSKSILDLTFSTLVLGPLDWAVVDKIQTLLDHKPIVSKIRLNPEKRKSEIIIGWRINKLTDKQKEEIDRE